MTFRTRAASLVRAVLYDPLIRATQAVAARVRALQTGSINAYLAYIVAVLVVLLGLVIGF